MSKPRSLLGPLSGALDGCHPAVSPTIRRHLLAGGAGLVLLFGVAGGWAATSEFAGAVIAPGIIVVESADKKVQHPTGGVVGEILVSEGDAVRAGDVILRLDGTVTRANLAIVSNSVDETMARLARLEAERDGTDDIAFPDALTQRTGVATVQRLMQSEQKLFHLRQELRVGQKGQLSQRIAQLRDEIDGLTRQVEAKAREVELISGELDGVRKLYRQKLVPLTRVNALERETARLEGERGQLIAATAQAKGKIAETELQILNVDQDLRSDVAQDMREAQAKIEELVQRKVAAEDQLRRIELRAPQEGTVHQLAVHTVGGVVAPGETVMVIVPAAELLEIEVRIAPQDIDHVRQGQAAMLRLLAFDHRATKEVPGTVRRVSPDLTNEDRTGKSFYTARIALAPEASEQLKALRLVPGMPVEAYIQTMPRTVLSYLTSPLVDQVRQAFRH